MMCNARTATRRAGWTRRALFYMRSRGLPEAEARALLIEAFLAGSDPGRICPDALTRGIARPHRAMAGARHERAVDQAPVRRRRGPRGVSDPRRAQVHGRPLVYLDNAASAQKPEAVIEAMAGAMRGSYANVHRGLHALGQRDNRSV